MQHTFQYDAALTQVMKDLGMEQQQPTTYHQQQQQEQEAPHSSTGAVVVAHSWSTVQKALAELLQQQQSSSSKHAVCIHINAKQCRDRWLNHLAPGIIKGNWTADEKDIIVQMATAAE